VSVPKLSETAISPDCLAAARQGERAARAALFDAVAAGTFALLKRIVRQRALAEDLLQDTMVAMFEHLHQYRGEAPFGAWVQRIAVSRALMAMRSPWNRARVALETFADADDVLPATPDPRTAELIDAERALQALAPQARAVVWLHEVEGWSHEEIAAAFGKTVSFSKSQLARAFAQLAKTARATERRVPASLL
jgi:RNA polymerase sigma-70 factor (ECF subfamily)